MAEEIKETSPFGGFDILQVRSDFNKKEEPTVKLEDKSKKIDTVETTEKDLEDKDNIETSQQRLEREKSEAEEVERTIKAQKESLKSKELNEIPKVTKEEDNESTLVTFAKYLGEKGIVEFDPEKFEDSDEGIANLVENEVVNRTTKQLKDYKESLPDDASKFLEFVEDGGDPKQFLDIYYGDKSFENFKADTEEAQKLVIRQGLKADGWDNEAIEEEIKDYEDLGKLEVKSKIHLSRLQKAEAETKATITQQQKLEKEKYLKAQSEYFENLKTDWFKKEDINGFKLTPKIKEDVWNHMTKPIDKKTGLTQLALNNQKNKDAQFIYAYLDYTGWDINKLEKQVANKATSKLADKLRNFSDSRSKGKTGISDIAKESDNTKNPFSMFETMKP